MTYAIQTRTAGKALSELNQTGKSRTDLVERVKSIFNFKGKSSDSDSVRLLMYAGRSVETDYAQRIFATVKLADMMFTCLPNCHANPLHRPIGGVLLVSTENTITRTTPPQEPMKEKFLLLKPVLYEHERINIGTFGNFLQKLGLARTMFHEIAIAIEQSKEGLFRSCKNSDSTMAYLASNFEQLQILFAGRTSKELTPAFVKAFVYDGKAIESCCNTNKRPFWKPPKQTTLQGRKKQTNPSKSKNTSPSKNKKPKRPRQHKIHTTVPANRDDHRAEDDIETTKNGLSSWLQNSNSSRPRMDNSPNGIYTNGIEPYTLDNNFPVIHVESFEDSEGNPCKGPDGEFSDFPYETSNGRTMTKVVCCPTTASYFYCFSDAHEKHHFVVEGERSETYRDEVYHHSKDISFHRYSIKDLRRKIQHNDEFFLFSEWTEEFKKHLDPKKLGFDVAFFVDNFESGAFQSKTTEENMKRGDAFCKHSLHLGYGRDGHNTSCRSTQEEEGGKSILAKPDLVSKKRREAYQKLKPFLDKMMDFMDEFLGIDGCKLFSDQERFEEFPLFRQYTDCMEARPEAATIVLQEIGTLEEVLATNFTMEATERHTDGPNCSLKGYQYTLVYSTIIKKGGCVYRFTVILYSRRSISRWMRKNFETRVLRQKLRDYRIEMNGYLSYEDFYLSNKMGHGACKIGASNTLYLIPPNSVLTPSFFYRQKHVARHYYKAGQGSRWEPDKMQVYERCKIEWEKAYIKTCDGTLLEMPGIKYFCLHENLNRFAYVSAYAHMVNKFRAKVDGCQRKHVVQLVYCALIVPGPAAFRWVVEELVKKIATQRKVGKANLILEYIDFCKGQNVFVTNGPKPRVQPQPGNRVESVVEKKLQEIMASMTKKIQALANGELLDEKGIIKQNIDTIHPIPYVREVGCIGFASMCVFTGLATSPDAIQTAKQSRVNNSSKNNPVKAMCDEIGIDFDTSGTISSGIWRPLAASIGEVPASIENGVCGNWRHKPTYDCFFHGQNLYNLSDTSRSVMVKAFGSKTWEPLNCCSFDVCFPSKEGL